MTRVEIAEQRITTLEWELLSSPFLHQKECGLVMAMAGEARRALGIKPPDRLAKTVRTLLHVPELTL